MVWFVVLLLSAAFAALGQLFAPKPESLKPADKPDLPDIDPTRPIPVVWGTVRIKDPQLIWWGDFASKPIKKKIFTGLWFKSTIVGYRYMIGMVLALCHGNLDGTSTGLVFDGIKKYTIDESKSFTPTNGDFNYYTVIDKPTLFGDKEKEGGIKALIWHYLGDRLSDMPFTAQDPNTYLASQLALTPSWRGLSYLVWAGPSYNAGAGNGYIGNAPRLWKFWIDVLRAAEYLFGTAIHYIDSNNDGQNKDANPVECLAELLINPSWGMGEPYDSLDYTSWNTAAITVHTEKNGFSYYWDRSTTIDQMASIILRQIDGTVYTDLTTGKIVIKLARADYDPDTLDTYNNDDFLEITSCTRGSIDDTINQVRVNYTNRYNEFNNDSVFDEDLANIQMQGQPISEEINYPGCSSPVLAGRLARRDLKVLASAPLRMEGTMDRRGELLLPGTVFKFSWPEQGYISVIMRVTKVNLGNSQKGQIGISAIEDLFAYQNNIFGTPGSGWIDPLGDPATPAAAGAEQLPWWIQRDDENRVIGYAVRDPGALSYNYNVNTITEENDAEFTPSGTLTVALTALGAVTGGSVTLNKPADFDAHSDTANDKLIIIEGEWLTYGSVTDNMDDTITLNSVKRAVLDTTPANHAIGARVWFILLGSGYSETTYVTSTTQVVEHLTRTLRGVLDAADAPNYNVDALQRGKRPYRPSYVTCNGVAYGTELANTASSDTVLDWLERNRLTENVTPVAADTTTTTPEGSTTYTVKVYNSDDTLIHTETAITGTTWTYTAAAETTDNGGFLSPWLTVKVYAVVGGLDSYQPWTRKITRDLLSGGGEFDLP